MRRFAKSGTVTLELALAGVPMVTAYRTGAVEAWIMRRAIKVKSVILANLVIGENVVPEFLQQDCTAEKLSPALREVLDGFSVAPATGRGLRKDRLRSCRPASQPPSVRAADIVLATMRKIPAAELALESHAAGCDGCSIRPPKRYITCAWRYRRSRGA